MEKNEILAKVQEIFVDILDNEDLVLSEDMNADDISGYDSLAHIQIVDQIGKVFGTKFKAREMMGWATIGEMIDCIYNKINQ